MESNDQTVDFIFQQLVDTGAIVLIGMHPTGEPVYRITEKCRDIFPEFYRVHKEQLSVIAYELWALGLVDIVFGDHDDKIVFNKTHHAKLKELREDLTLEQVDFLVAVGAPLSYMQKE
jgi:hypothetical protein